MIIARKSTETLTAVELDVDDELHFELANGEVRRIKLVFANAVVVKQGLFGEDNVDGVLAYRIACELSVDDGKVNLVRTIPSQENFRDPAQIMGMRIWLDAVDEIGDFLEESHGDCLPGKKCRLAVWDASRRICPPLLHPWCPLPEGGLRVEDCYRGEDTWLGPYDGKECHGGLDINHPAGTPLFTPISIDEHELFGRAGENAPNNRWRGLHHWDDGKTWVLQTAHMVKMLVEAGQPIEAGVKYAEGAGVWVGAHEHSHFVFRVREDGQEILLDPWLLFWQMYEDRKLTQA